MIRQLISTSGVLFTLMGTSLALARGVTPLSGMEWISAERTCFTNGWNQLTNSNCNGYRKWLFDAPIDTTDNYHSVHFYGRGNGSTVVKCWAWGMSATGDAGYVVYAERASASWGELSPGGQSLYVPWYGNIYVDCDLPLGGGISAFHYTT